ncbi:hypothetical protein K505DRAFT_416902, partial [Melanomma pulvis-pyrius CBS 109.77]
MISVKRIPQVEVSVPNHMYQFVWFNSSSIPEEMASSGPVPPTAQIAPPPPFQTNASDQPTYQAAIPSSPLTHYITPHTPTHSSLSFFQPPIFQPSNPPTLQHLNPTPPTPPSKPQQHPRSKIEQPTMTNTTHPLHLTTHTLQHLSLLEQKLHALNTQLELSHLAHAFTQQVLTLEHNTPTFQPHLNPHRALRANGPRCHGSFLVGATGMLILLVLAAVVFRLAGRG